MTEVAVSFEVEFTKTDVTGRYVRGFASVVEKDGQAVVDSQGDTIDIEELRQAAHEFSKIREGRVMHGKTQVADIVEIVIVDDAFAKAVGMTDTRRGLWIGMIVNDETTREKVKSGELRAFSIGGQAVREAVA